MQLRELVHRRHLLKERLKQLQAQQTHLQEEVATMEQTIRRRLDECGDDYEGLSEEEFQVLMADFGDVRRYTVEVVYATPERQLIKEVQVPRGSRIEDAIALSEILAECPEVDLKEHRVGVFGAIKPLSSVLNDGDRVEIYRAIAS